MTTENKPKLRLLIVSDLHCEFHRDNGASLAACLPEADVLVLAGDITLAQQPYIKAFDHFVDRYKHVLMVNGNHEYYLSDPTNVHKALREYSKAHPNFHWLLNDVVEIEGQRFLGTTLWFSQFPGIDSITNWLNDFQVITNFRPWVFDQHQSAVEFLTREMRLDDIVITHHAPSWRSQHPRFAGSPYSRFFIHDMEPLIQERQPKLWAHGHCHTSSYYLIGRTKVICNPFGYAAREENPGFQLDKIIEV